MRTPFLPTHRILFRPVNGALETTPVMLRRGEVWTLDEWEALPSGQEWTHDHEWVIQDGEWLWVHGVDGPRCTPGGRSGEVRIEPNPDSGSMA